MFFFRGVGTFFLLSRFLGIPLCPRMSVICPGLSLDILGHPLKCFAISVLFPSVTRPTGCRQIFKKWSGHLRQRHNMVALQIFFGTTGTRTGCYRAHTLRREALL